MLVLLLLATSIAASFTDNASKNFTFAADASGVCITGPVALNTYIALGIPPQQPNATKNLMTNATMLLVYQSEFGSRLVKGKGSSLPTFEQASNAAVLNRTTYSNGMLHVCFEQNVDASATLFIWATGAISKGVVQQHKASDHGIVRNVSLFDKKNSTPVSSVMATAVITKPPPTFILARTKTSHDFNLVFNLGGLALLFSLFL
ncbi:hypothetical protein BCR33DRAFT_851187 [Rhizoclosmatium globosum]|uniref:DOMON domain-containing protein n=1 Tax=Rhizoclosmatium globosum TaxID=329046 RepID=A0A1Y2C8X0_9FUNG|nr:hypothetical protein BCR33DRAFT_851187 [Rhizoclosmatium globosum]|eukprot:ORY43468.1 hypothetical protein BCR33DRAFT_851187 [Rhizoclosmatium globosum]